jgi:hypothetical protein
MRGGINLGTKPRAENRGETILWYRDLVIDIQISTASFPPAPAR